MAASWFIAAESDCSLLARHSDAFIALFRNHVFSYQGNRRVQWLMARLHKRFTENHRRTLFWTSEPTLRYLKAIPYFIFHYLFNRLALTDPEFGRMWAASRSLPAANQLMLHRMAAGPAADALAHLEAHPSPLQKLNWRVDPTSGYWRSVLDGLSARLDYLSQDQPPTLGVRAN